MADITHIFPFTDRFPELFARSTKVVEMIPVFFEDKQVATTTINPKGEFPIVLAPAIENLIRKGSISFLPLFDELNRNPDPSKIRVRITGIRLIVRPRERDQRGRAFGMR